MNGHGLARVGTGSRVGGPSTRLCRGSPMPIKTTFDSAPVKPSAAIRRRAATTCGARGAGGAGGRLQAGGREGRQAGGRAAGSCACDAGGRATRQGGRESPGRRSARPSAAGEAPWMPARGRKGPGCLPPCGTPLRVWQLAVSTPVPRRFHLVSTPVPPGCPPASRLGAQAADREAELAVHRASKLAGHTYGGAPLSRDEHRLHSAPAVEQSKLHLARAVHGGMHLRPCVGRTACWGGPSAARLVRAFLCAQ